MALKTALLVIDVQKDFCEGGILSARDTASLIIPLNMIIKWTLKNKMTCIFTRDWHPSDHASFIKEGGTWPPHCIQNTPGAEFADGLDIPVSKLVIDLKKDTLREEMSYSAFGHTGLDSRLRALRIETLGVAGIATEYCVKESVLDALQSGFRVFLITDLIRSIELEKGDTDKALKEMKDKGAELILSGEWMRKFR